MKKILIKLKNKKFMMRRWSWAIIDLCRIESMSMIDGAHPSMEITMTSGDKFIIDGRCNDVINAFFDIENQGVKS